MIFVESDANVLQRESLQIEDLLLENSAHSDRATTVECGVVAI